MANSRKPLKAAEIEGRTLKNPQRYRDRHPKEGKRPLGEPYAKMTEAEKRAWYELQEDLPWLHSSHRPITRLACLLIAKQDEGELSDTAARALLSVLGKLGATPTDECRIAWVEEEDSDDEFFRTH